MRTALIAILIVIAALTVYTINKGQPEGYNSEDSVQRQVSKLPQDENTDDIRSTPLEQLSDGAAEAKARKTTREDFSDGLTPNLILKLSKCGDLIQPDGGIGGCDGEELFTESEKEELEALLKERLFSLKQHQADNAVVRGELGEQVFEVPPFPDDVFSQIAEQAYQVIVEEKADLFLTQLAMLSDNFDYFGAYSQKVWLDKGSDPPALLREYHDQRGKSKGSSRVLLDVQKEALSGEMVPAALLDVQHIITTNGEDGWGFLEKETKS